MIVKRQRRHRITAPSQFLEDLRVDLRWRFVHELVAVERGDHVRALVVVECARRAWAWRRLCLGFLRAVVARAVHAEREARGDDANDGDEEQHALHHRRLREKSDLCAKSSAVGSDSVSPSKDASFFWTSTIVFALCSSCSSFATCR